MYRKILIMGLPGAGKTTLAKALAPRLNAAHFNADEVRTNINKDLGFSEADRIEQARRMGWLCDRSLRPAASRSPTSSARRRRRARPFTEVARRDRGSTASGRVAFEDTNRMFVAARDIRPACYGRGIARILGGAGGEALRPVFDQKKPTALFIGRYQPFHDGHKALIVEGCAASAKPASRCATRTARTTRTRSSSNMCAPASSMGCASSRDASNRAAAEHHQRVLWPRRRLCGRADRARQFYPRSPNCCHFGFPKPHFRTSEASLLPFCTPQRPDQLLYFGQPLSVAVTQMTFVHRSNTLQLVDDPFPSCPHPFAQVGYNSPQSI